MKLLNEIYFNNISTPEISALVRECLYMASSKYMYCCKRAEIFKDKEEVFLQKPLLNKIGIKQINSSCWLHYSLRIKFLVAVENNLFIYLEGKSFGHSNCVRVLVDVISNFLQFTTVVGCSIVI